MQQNSYESGKDVPTGEFPFRKSRIKRYSTLQTTGNFFEVLRKLVESKFELGLKICYDLNDEEREDQDESVR